MGRHKHIIESHSTATEMKHKHKKKHTDDNETLQVNAMSQICNARLVV